jgi:hypothetical protein
LLTGGTAYVPEDLLQSSGIEVLDASDGEDTDLVPVFGDDFSDEIRRDTKTIQYESVDVFEQSLRM